MYSYVRWKWILVSISLLKPTVGRLFNIILLEPRYHSFQMNFHTFSYFCTCPWDLKITPFLLKIAKKKDIECVLTFYLRISLELKWMNSEMHLLHVNSGQNSKNPDKLTGSISPLEVTYWRSSAKDTNILPLPPPHQLCPFFWLPSIHEVSRLMFQILSAVLFPLITDSIHCSYIVMRKKNPISSQVDYLKYFLMVTENKTSVLNENIYRH